jgi:hypothetical protein
VQAPSFTPDLALGTFLPGLTALLCFGTERMTLRGWLPGGAAFTTHILTCLATIVGPIWIGWHVQGAPLGVFALLVSGIIVFAKLVSFVHVNRDLRLRGDAAYTKAVDFRNFRYALFAPTLCYDVEYPRTERINWRRAGRLAGTGLACVFATGVLVSRLAVLLPDTVTAVDHGT